MSRDPIRRWRDQPVAAADHAPGDPAPDKLAVRFFRALKPLPRDPRAVSRLLGELVARAEKGEIKRPRALLFFRMAFAALLFGSFGGALAAVHPAQWQRMRALVRELVQRPADVAVSAARKHARKSAPLPAPAPLTAPEPMVAPAPIAEPASPHRARPHEIHAEAPAPTVAAPTALGPGAASVGGSPPDDSRALESSMVDRALAALSQHRPQDALAALGEYHQRFPHGELEYDADRAEVTAQMALGRNAAALAVLDRATAIGDFDALPGSLELSVLRAELLARTGDCTAALPAFSGLLGGQHLEPALQERAVYGRAICLAKLGQRAESRRALRDYLNRFPNGRFVGAVQDALDPLK